MKIQYLSLIMLSLSLWFTSCSDVLDMAPDGNMQMDEVLADPDKVEALLNRCYNNIPQKGYSYWFFDNIVVASSDDGYTSDEGQGVPTTAIYQDNNNASSHNIRDAHDGHGGNNTGYWTRAWQQIRLCSQFIEVIDKAAVNRDTDRGRFKAEARVLRAFFYMELVKWFGKVPVLNETVPFDANFSTLTRSSVYDVAKFIIADCDAALAEPNLPWRLDNGNDAMRVTKALAHALRAKAMLFAASPLHNQGQNYWEEAYTIAKDAVTNLKSNGFELFTKTTQPNLYGTGPAAALRQLVTQSADYSATPRDKETLYQVRSGGVFVWHIGYIGSNMANTYKCGTTPTQELVDAFETINGLPVLDLKKPYLDEKHLQPNYNTENTQYDKNNPYANRDPRFYQTVLHNGSKILFDNKTVEVQTFTGGPHAPSFDITNRVSSRTGYYHTKMVTPGASGNNGINNANWKYYRLGETLLDLAEAAAEAGHLDEARTAANEVRARSGMPPLSASLSQADLILRIRNERRVELAWEEQRYFDLRRWQTPTGDLSETSKWFTAMVITKNNNGTFSYARRNISNNARGGWQNRDLLLPLPLNEAATLESVTGQKWQNPGW
ncbi:RagB/SusD family nutrient uptake outer membrane protein [Sphingobacterium psychroaquaticum]|uniref:RagB/SusD family nutrient uptake outer membrane protein n=1 Tax=Sphingobacterium psychroaquaticum TaxID=561061 RepID=UPI00106B6639|nr:RagB/SusD family nutrient uptake outer membrane protein [Sphingobacterium psychroaquaticum]QBQ39942.1 RagB/SusD family nutrient uptake outer membrane protein [Sphingobacterium psychroaquaticum]